MSQIFQSVETLTESDEEGSQGSGSKPTKPGSTAQGRLTLRTSLDTEVPMEQRLQDPVTYSFAQDGNKGICFAMGVCKQLGVLKAVPSRVTDPPKECTTTV